MSGSYTPGPWYCSGAAFEDDGGVSYNLHAADMAISAANARLIAAAPELLEACRSAEDFLATVEDDAALAIYDQLRAAIAKARGEQS